MMEFLRLSFATLLPWLGGYLWLAVLERRLGVEAPSTLRQLGYGLFVGYAALQGVVLAGHASTGAVEYWRINSVLVLLTLAAGLLLAREWLAGEGDTRATPAGERERAGVLCKRFMLVVLTAWAALHLLLIAVEILHRPVFPWDAWLNWIYRAKAWYLTGEIAAMDSPGDWLLGTGTARFNVAGSHYPTFSPVLALWCATALGHWSETLINLPYLCCGIALWLAIYGQCREEGMAHWLSALAAWLLLSIPLLDTHLALAGQADIWMAGFTGLGLVALLRGLARGESWQTLLGLGMTAMGMAVKSEGGVWFMGALLTLALTRWPRGALRALAVLVVLALLGWLFGLTYLRLPLLGGVGFDEGRIHIPLLGSYALQAFELWDDYLDNFLKNGTWHLLWSFVLLSAAALWLQPAGMQRRAVAVFYGVLLAAQLFIFEGTEQGRWAEDWTAINRLPLHFAPALVFSIVVAARGLPAGSLPGFRSAGSVLRGPLVGLAVVLSAALAWLLVAYPGSGAEGHSFTPQEMRTVMGGSRAAAQGRIIERYENNVALLSSGPVALDAAKLGLLRVETAGPNRNRATFFWRNGDDPSDLHSAELSGRGVRWINLDATPGWQGTVREVGIVFYSDGGRPVELRGLEVRSQSLGAQLAKLAGEWRETSYWSQKSVHWLPAGAPSPSISLPLLMAAWVVVTALRALTIGRRTPDAFTGALLCAVIAWGLLELRWSANGLVQAGATVAEYPLASAEYLAFGDDEQTARLVELAQPAIGQTYKRTVIAAEDPDMRFQMFRAKYHALPASALVHDGPLESAPVRIGDYLLVLNKRYAEAGHKSASAAEYAAVLLREQGIAARPVLDEPEGFLLEIPSRAGAEGSGQ
jgi:hypothetical protein